MEFQRRRLDVIAEQRRLIGNTRRDLQSIAADIGQKLANNRIKQRTAIDVDALTSALSSAVSGYTHQLDTVLSREMDVDADDPIRARLDPICDGRVGTSYSQQQLDEIRAEGEARAQDLHEDRMQRQIDAISGRVEALETSF